MPFWVKAAAGWGSILVLIALAIAFLKQLIAFVVFLTFAIKALIVLVFIALIAVVGYLVIKAWQNKKRASD